MMEDSIKIILAMHKKGELETNAAFKMIEEIIMENLKSVVSEHVTTTANSNTVNYEFIPTDKK